MLHFRHLATPVVVEFVDGKPMSTNIDKIDPEGFSEKIDFDWDDVILIEKISEERFFHLSEMAAQRTQFQRIQGILGLKQIVEAGRQANVIQDIVEEKPIPKFPAKHVKKVEEAPKVQMTTEPEETEDLLEEPAQSCIQPLAAVPIKDDYDGAVVNLPAPGVQ